MLSKEVKALIEANAPELVNDPKWMEWRSGSLECIMHVAARCNPKCLFLLLKTKGGRALMDRIDGFGRSPICRAVENDQKESVRLLIAAGAHSWCISARDCPLAYAVHMSCNGHGKQAVELGVAMFSSRPKRAERQKFLDEHKKFRKQSPLWELFFDLCVSTMNVRCARAYQAVGTMLFCLKKRIGKSQKDVFRNILTPMLRHIWEQQRYEECWDIPEHQELQSN